MNNTLLNLLNSNKVVYEQLVKENIVGITENQLKSKILEIYKKELGEFTFEGDIVAGVNSSIGEGTGTDYVIKKGDTIILDLLPGKDGYYCDTTRTFFLGDPTNEQRKVYNIVKKALLETEKILKPNITASEIYQTMKDNLVPYENTFFHHAGHLTGTARLLQPQFLPNNKTKLKVGDIITLEPGIYIKDKFGVRLENNYIITNTGYERLLNYSLEIEDFIIGEKK